MSIVSIYLVGSYFIYKHIYFDKEDHFLPQSTLLKSKSHVTGPFRTLWCFSKMILIYFEKDHTIDA